MGLFGKSPKIRVLVVDESAGQRQTVSEVLGEDSELEIVATATDGATALASIGQSTPDVVIVDAESAGSNALQTFNEIRKSFRLLPVIFCSCLRGSNLAVTIDALLSGAADYAPKPVELENGKQKASLELVSKIKRLCPRTPLAPPRPITRELIKRNSLVREPIAPGWESTRILAIGTSTGGPQALSCLIPALSRELPGPIVIVQHMPKEFTGTLATRLTAVSGFCVREGRAGELLQPGEIWVAPGGRHMEVQRSPDGIRLMTTEEPPENSCRPAADVLFRSVAALYGPNALAVVLTGMGQDGMKGCESIRQHGGQVLVQDEASSVVWGMPGAVVRAGLADMILPLEDLAHEINRRMLRPCPGTSAPRTRPPASTAGCDLYR